jgi:hypothetical protein
MRLHSFHYERRSMWRLSQVHMWMFSSVTMARKPKTRFSCRTSSWRRLCRGLDLAGESYFRGSFPSVRVPMLF